MDETLIRHTGASFRFPTLLLAAAALLAGCAAAPQAGRPAAAEPAPSSMAELTASMTPGINLGNTMEALPDETA